MPARALLAANFRQLQIARGEFILVATQNGVWRDAACHQIVSYMAGINTLVEGMNTLARSPLFSGVEKRALEAIAGAMVAEYWPKHAQILTAAQTAERFVVIAQGRVKITCSNEDTGRELIVWLLGPGDAFDMVALLDGESHQVSAWALDDVRAFSAPVAFFRNWLERSPPFRLAAHRYVARQLRELTSLASDLALHGTMARLAHLLLRHFDTSTKRPAASSSVNLIQDLPHEELAYLIGSVRVVVSRLLGQLKREGVVDMQGGAVRMINLKRLLRRAEQQMRGAKNGPRALGK